MPKRTKPWGPDTPKPDFVDYQREICISHDHLQWIIQRGWNRYFYGTLEMALNRLADELVRDWMGIEKKAVLKAHRELRAYISNIVKDIKNPMETKYGNT